MKFNRFILVLIIFLTSQNYCNANNIHFLDFKLVLNESDAGKKAQTFLKKKLEQGIKSIEDKTKKILDEEKKLIEQKKIISNEEYKKKVTELRSKVSLMQQERGKLLKDVSNKRAKAKKQLLESLNPIVKQYMMDYKIQIVLDKNPQPTRQLL